MGGAGAVDRWAEQQKSKALHVGTYEAAIENMLRRMNDQPEGDAPFYLYRVVLDDAVGIEPGVHREPTNWVGDAQPEEFLTPGHSVYRYIKNTRTKAVFRWLLPQTRSSRYLEFRYP